MEDTVGRGGLLSAVLEYVGGHGVAGSNLIASHRLEVLVVNASSERLACLVLKLLLFCDLLIQLLDTCYSFRGIQIYVFAKINLQIYLRPLREDP